MAALQPIKRFFGSAGPPSQYHLPTRSWGYDQEPDEHTCSPNDNAFSWGKKSSPPYDDNHSTWSRRNLNNESRIWIPSRPLRNSINEFKWQVFKPKNLPKR